MYIPKGQFMRIRRNCSKEGDFLQQSEVLANRFIEKGYEVGGIEIEKRKVLNMHSECLLLEGKQQGSYNQECNMILDYNVQFRQVEKIIRKDWNTLKKDKVLGPLLHIKPGFIYKKAQSLKDLIAPGVIDPPKRKRGTPFGVFTGFYACGKCKVCCRAKYNGMWMRAAVYRMYI